MVGDLDAQARALTIRRSLAAVVGGPIEKDTKTHAARRIALDKATLAALAAHRATAVERTAIGGFPFVVNSFMLTSADGVSPVHPDALTSLFRRTYDRLGLKGVRLHDLRHQHGPRARPRLRSDLRDLHPLPGPPRVLRQRGPRPRTPPDRTGRAVQQAPRRHQPRELTGHRTTTLTTSNNPTDHRHIGQTCGREVSWCVTCRAPGW